MNTLEKPIHEYTTSTELRRLSVFDRLALHGGLALIRWAQREQPSVPSEQHRIDAGRSHRFDSVSESRERIERAVMSVLDQGLRTADIMSAGMYRVGTLAMGDAVVAALSGE